MTGFDSAFQILLGHEGTFSDHPDDPGGATQFGITERVARAWGYTGLMRDLKLAMAKAIAKSEYWDRYKCDQFDPRIGLQIFDTAYNGGMPVLWLQEAVGVRQDGAIGAQTIAAVRAADPLQVVIRFNASRLQYLTGLKGWPSFGKGWTRRSALNLSWAVSCSRF